MIDFPMSCVMRREGEYSFSVRGDRDGGMQRFAVVVCSEGWGE